LAQEAPNNSHNQQANHGSRTSHQTLPGLAQSEFKKNTIEAYRDFLSKLCDEFGSRELESLSSAEFLSFL
jgi:hypothetical protein